MSIYPRKEKVKTIFLRETDDAVNEGFIHANKHSMIRGNYSDVF